MLTSVSSRLCAVCLALALSCAAIAQAPMGARPAPSHDFHVATAGSYTTDLNHTSVIARVPHMGFGYNVFRFGDVAGALTWDPAAPESAQLDVSVRLASIGTPVMGHDGKPWGESLMGEFLKGNAFPTAMFHSTAFHVTSPTTGTVDGTLTLLGVAKPVQFNVQLNGAGRNMFGKTVMGVYATATINPQDYGMAAMVGNKADLVIDTEFDRQS